MPGTTLCANLPYPIDSDPIDAANDIRLLAQATDTYLCGFAKLPLGAIIPYWDTGAVLDAKWLRMDGSPFNPVDYPHLSSYLGGATVVPDLRGRFLRGTDAPGGTFATPGGFGGWADAIVVEHDHSNSHNHPNFEIGGGDHKHRMRGSNDNTAGGGFGEGNIATWSLTGFTVLRDTEITTHTHQVDMPNYTGTTSSVGAAGTNRNLPPFANVTFIIKATP